MDKKSKYLELVTKLNEYIDMYYNSQNSPISDAEYDKLYQELVGYEKRNPTWVVPDSPTQKVGARAESELDKKQHYSKMYSLDNTFNRGDLETFWKRFSKLRAKYSVDLVDNFYCDYKMDGLSCEIWYKDGRVALALTRGDGMIGEDVTANVLTITNLPKYISVKHSIIIRGEVIVYRSDFERINAERKLAKLPEFSNLRNFASGSLRQKDPQVTAERYLRFYAWELIDPVGEPIEHNRAMKALCMLGFNVPDSRLCKSVDEILDFANETVANRRRLAYDIDGIVIKQNNPKFYKEIGWNKHAPLFNIAYKFVAQDADTIITEINWGIGKTGKLTPVATIEPVNLGGCTISNVTLNNADYVENNRVGIGAKIKVIRSADVIPKIKSILDPGKYHAHPDKCPHCGAPTVRVGTELKCTNDNCKGRLISNLNYIVGKDILDIKGIGPKFIEEIVNKGIVTKLLDIFQPLTSTSESVSQELLDKLVVAARNMTAEHAIVSLAIPKVGKGLASKIIVSGAMPGYSGILCFRKLLTDRKRLHTILINASTEAVLLEWYAKEANHKLLDDLIALDLNMCK